MPLPRMFDGPMSTLASHEPSPSHGRRVASSSPATTPYGSQARAVDMWGRLSSAAGAMWPIHPGAHSARGAKSQVSRGTHQPRRAAAITRAIPTAPPTSDGNSGPSSTAQARYGAVNATAAKRAKGQAARPSRTLRRGP